MLRCNDQSGAARDCCGAGDKPDHPRSCPGSPAAPRLIGDNHDVGLFSSGFDALVEASVDFAADPWMEQNASYNRPASAAVDRP